MQCEVFVAIRCQAVESVSYLVHRLATVATCPPSGEVFVAIRCQAVESVSYLVHRLATVATCPPSGEVFVAIRCQAVERQLFSPPSGDGGYVSTVWRRWLPGRCPFMHSTSEKR